MRFWGGEWGNIIKIIGQQRNNGDDRRMRVVPLEWHEQ